ncbi:response regulator, partial [bacterium]|nr:response regulator [bacterium]
EHIYSIGGSSSTLDPFDISMLEGEFGKAAAFGKTVRIQNIPRDTVFKLRSIAGTAIPTEIITIPVKAYNQVKAIISLASLTPFSKDDLLIIDLVLSSINTAFANIIAIEETRLLARELEVKNQELESQTTEMRRQSYELVDQNTELERQQKEVEEANRLKSEFLSNMSHELRTPLNSIMALSRILARRTKDIISEEESEFLEIIERNGKQLLALINDILDLSKIEAGKVELECQKFSIPSIIDTILSSVGHLAAEKNIAINQQFEVGLPDIESDQSRVHQILQNIIGNAIKFTMRGSVSILVNRQPGNIIIQVKDTGIGISRETLPHIFDEFRQGDGSASRRYEGTGLGLAIAYKAANLLGGNIKVESALGQGTTFTVLLPFKREQMSLDVSKTASIASTPSFQLDLDSTQKTGFALGATGYITKPITKQALMSEIKKVVSPGPRSILLVEDNESAIIQVTHTLRAAGYQVDVARGGQEAIDFVQNTIPDGIVLDLMMPEVNGFEVLDKIRGTEATAEIPVLILTAKDLSKKDLKKLSANNVQQLVQKGDVDPDNLLFEIQLMLGTKPRPLSITSRIEKPTVTHPVRTETPVKKKEGKPSILIVEDNPDNMFTIKAILGDSYHLLEAIDGEAGLEATQTALPDLVLLDMSLPKMDGFQVVREIKANDQTRSIPVIAITARAMKGEKEKILEAGCDNYISKPIDPDLLVDEIKKWLK